MSRDRAWRWLSAAFGLVGLTYLVVALRDGAAELQGLPSPGPSAWAIMVVAMIASLMVAYRLWMALLGKQASIRSMSVYLVAQLGKYIPGGIWQPTAQVVGFTRSAEHDIGTGQAAISFLVQALTQVAAASPFAIWLWIVGPSKALALLLAAILVAISVVLVNRPLLHGLVRLWARLRARARAGPDVPRGRLLLGAVLGGIVVLALQGWVFAAFVETLTGQRVPHAILVYAVAWAIGFLALPLPAGLGLREAVMVALVPGGAAELVIAASVGVRVVQIAAEACLLVVAWGVRVMLDRRAHTVVRDDQALGADEPDRPDGGQADQQRVRGRRRHHDLGGEQGDS